MRFQLLLAVFFSVVAGFKKLYATDGVVEQDKVSVDLSEETPLG